MGRSLPLAIAAGSFLGIAVSGWSMVHRVREFNRSSPRVTFAFQEVLPREFVYADRPVSILDETDEQTGWIFAVVRYAEESLRLRASLQVDQTLPDTQKGFTSARRSVE